MTRSFQHGHLACADRSPRLSPDERRVAAVIEE
jgi:hypothetical protein